MDLSASTLFASLFVSSIGFGLFLYGKKQARIPQLVGQYVFGDFIFGRLLHMDLDSGLIQELSILPTGDSLPNVILGFGQDEAGELYLLGLGENNDGVVVRLVPEPTTLGLFALGAFLLPRRRRTV